VRQRFTFLRRQVIPAPIAAVADFFAEAGNLEEITPPWLAFRIVEGGGVQVDVGTRLIYRLYLFGIPLRWVTMIERFSPGLGFIDVQVEGPYRSWVHSHLFSPVTEGVVMDDRVDYELPFGRLGALAQPLIALQLAGIFRYRRRAIERRFPER
jgi:ligand-binding SRPBCC domain-containing protein